MVGPDYTPPEMELPVDYYTIGQPQTPGATAQANSDSPDAGKKETLAQQSWESVFDDPVLATLIASALDENLTLAAVRARLRQTEAVLEQARASLWPQLGVSLTGQNERDLVNRNADGTKSELLGAFAWELDFFGFNRRRIELAKARVLGAEHQVYLQEVALIGGVATAYFELLDVIARETITRQTIKTRERALEILKLRKASGIISGLAVRQAEVALAEAEGAMPALLNRHQVLENALSVLVGQAPDSIGVTARLDDDVSGFVNVPRPLPTGLPSELLRRRPDVLVAEAEVRAATALVGVSQADLLPRIRLTGDFGLQSDRLGELLSSGGETWNLAGSITQPVFRRGELRARVVEAQALREEALARYKSTVLIALSEVSAAIQAYTQSESLVEINSRRTASAREYLHLATLRYQEGALGYLDVLDAQRQLFDAELSRSSALRQRLVALASIYRALGGGWTEDVASG